MKIVTKTYNNFKLFIFHGFPFFSIRSLILCLKLPTKAHNVSWGISAHSLRKDVFKALTLWWATEESFAFNIDNIEKSLNSNQGIQDSTSPYSKILENDVCTSLEFLLRCGMILHLFERWKADLWNVLSFLQKLELKYY